MKIGIFTDVYFPQINGVVTSVMTLQEELIRRGHEVTVITVRLPGYKESTDGIIRLKSVPFSKWKEFRLAMPFFVSAYSQIKALNLDIIHTHTEFSVGLLGRYIANTLNIPLVHTYHTMYEDYTHYILDYKYAKKVVRRLIIRGSKSYVKPATAIIAPSEKTKLALQSYGIRNQIYVMPTGINLGQFSTHPSETPAIAAIRERYHIDDDTNIMLSLGRISEEKSINMIIEQMPSILSIVPNTVLLIVGDGPYRSKLESLVHKLNLEESVIFTGKVPFDTVSYYYNVCDVFISASKTETQGLTIIEAMASNKPVVVYDDDNVKGLIKHNHSGMLFTKHLGLSDGVISILTNKDKATFLSDNGTIAIKNLSTEKFGDTAEMIYEDLIQYMNMYKYHVI